MSEKAEKRTVSLFVRIRPSLKAMLDQAIEDDGRPIGRYVERVLMEHLAKTGYAPTNEAVSRTKREV